MREPREQDVGAGVKPGVHGESAWRYWPLAVIYSIVGVAAYWTILPTFFVADDFAYLIEMSKAESPAVIFSPLAGRYFRPVVVLVYYLNYQLSALEPWTYHASVVLVHIVNAWLVFLLGRAIAPGRGVLAPALAGGLFLVLGNHAEAITWIAGTADPLVTMFLLIALLCFMRSLEREWPIPYIAGACVAFAAALLSKESAAVFVGFVAVATALGAPGWPDRQRVRRAMMMLAALGLMLVAYFALRRSVLGFTFVTLDGLGTSTNHIATARRFILRAFLPNGSLLNLIWDRRLDAIVIAPIVGLLLWLANRRDYRPLVLLGALYALALAPIMPLSISLTTPESERLIYLTTAFSSLLTVFLLDAALKKPAVVVAVTMIFSAWHLRALEKTNALWVAAASLTRSQTASFGNIVREHGRTGLPIFVLNVTDNVRGVFIWRRGFHDALALTSPQHLAEMSQTTVLSVTQVWDEHVPVTVKQVGAGAFALRITSGAVLGGPVTTGLYSLTNWSTAGFTAEFTPAAARGLVVYFTPSEAKLAGRVEGEALAFGNIDTPKDELSCREGLTLQGWALDTDGVARVAIQAEGATPDVPAREIAQAARVARPDVAAAYPGYPDSAQAGWTVTAPCATTGVSPGTRIRVTAINSRGRESVLGTRTVGAQ